MSDSPVLAALAELHTTLTGRLDAMSDRLEHVESGQGRMRVEIMGRIDRLRDHLIARRLKGEP